MSALERRYDDAAFLAALDQLIARLQSRHSSIRVRRIDAEDNPSGDDWIWYFTHPDSPVTVQVDLTGRRSVPRERGVTGTIATCGLSLR